MTFAQRKRFWAMLGDIAAQVQWPVNGERSYLDKEDWRLIFCAALVKENRRAEGINGGFVMLGLRLRDIFKDFDEETSKRMASDLIELISAFGSERGVVWSDPQERGLMKARDEEARRAA